jgi:DNA-binding GntR family transcriptional regulator
VTRMPVREAMKILTAEQLLMHAPHRGYFVADIGEPEVQQVYRFRMFIEHELLLAIRQVPEEVLDDLEGVLDRMDANIAASRYADALGDEREFYFALFDLSRLTLFATEAKRLWDISEPYRSDLNSSATAADPTLATLRRTRREMLDAARLHDGVRLADLVRSQRRAALDYFSATLRSISEQAPKARR